MTMRHGSLALVTCLLATAMSACRTFDQPTNCTDEWRPGIAVQVRDSLTNASPGLGSLVVATDAAYADTSIGQISGVYYVTHERPGTYTVTVAHTGYQTWTRGGVTVTKDQCHVTTVPLTARLVK